MSKLLKNGTLRRLTAFLLAFCCLFSMAPTAFAADDGDPSTDYREIWVISQPGVPVQITRGAGDEPVVKIADQTYTEGEQRVWNNTKIATINGEQYYVVDPDNMSVRFQVAPLHKMALDISVFIRTLMTRLFRHLPSPIGRVQNFVF